MLTSTEILEQRTAVLAHISALATLAETEARELTVEEVSTRDEFARQAGTLNARAISAKADEDAEQVRTAAAARVANGTGDQSANDAGGNVGVRSSERTYRKGGEVSYLKDMALNAFGNRGAAERLARHAGEIAVDAESARSRIVAGSGTPLDSYLISQVRAGMGASGMGEYQARTGDLSTAAGAGGEFVPPAFEVAEYVPFARAGRVVADSVTQAELPPGTLQINLPKVTSGTTVDTQGTGSNPTAQNVAISDTALATAYDTFPVVTIAGGQSVSLQLIERAPIDFSSVTSKDLLLALGQKVDAKVIAGAGSGDILGLTQTSSIVAVTWTTSSQAYPGFWNMIANAKAQIASARFLPATHLAMTPARWEWLESMLDDNGRPLFSPQSNGPWNVPQVSPDTAVAEGVTGGRVQGLTALQDFNIPQGLGVGTNQDIVLVYKADDSILYESPVISRALPQTLGNQLTVLVQLYEYAAFTANRYPKSTGVISGTGLVTPVFTS